MRRQMNILLTLIKMKLSKKMAFRFSFFGAFFIDGSMFLIQIFMFSAIYSQAGSIGNWSRSQMLLFIGTFSLINALNMWLYFFGLISIPLKIKSGQMDLYITKPVNPLFHLTFESMDLGSVPLIFASIGIIVYAAAQADIILSFGRVIGYIFLVLVMLLLWYDMMVIMRTIPFFTVQASSIEQLEGELITLCMKIPGNLFKGIFKLIFQLFLPYGIMATVPAQFFTGVLSPGGFVYAIIIVLAFTAFTMNFWKLGLRNYKSAS